MSLLKKHNFGAGPCILPAEVLSRAADAVSNWNGSGLSVLEVSHRSAAFEQVVHECISLVRELLGVPEGYTVLMLQGGASLQFDMVPMNFLQGRKKAAYLDTGFFAIKAIKAASLFGRPEVVASSAAEGYKRIPDSYCIPEDAAYFHCTSNNTIEGTQMFDFPDSPVPVICDMSSDIFSREIDVSKFDLIYAGAQKNIGPAGMTLVIIKDSLMEKAYRRLPAMLDYRVHKEGGSMYNTPPVFSIYTATLNLQWLKACGGVRVVEALNRQKATALYTEIDHNPLFTGTADYQHRSRMNICFKALNQTIEQEFLSLAEQEGIIGIRGYRTVGGFRASLYNALPLSSVVKLTALMNVFRKNKSCQPSEHLTQ